MIISHQYKYLFIEIPLTASWAISQELCQHYGGASILHKHATYAEFRRIAAPEELTYFVFATVRNPLDTIVSRYMKFTSDHKGTFSSPTSVEELVADYSDIQKYIFIKNTHANFGTYFRKYFKIPFSDMIDLSGGHLDFVIRFENLQQDFSRLLHRLNICQVRPIPTVNKTRGKDKPFASYYSPELADRARRICGPFMRKWGYEFPSDWEGHQSTLIDQAEYIIFNKLRYFYMIYLRYNDANYARVLRRLRARFY
jgi:hypothetical protein